MDANKNLEDAIDILAGLITRDMDDDTCESILNAIHYLRSGNFRPFRKK